MVSTESAGQPGRRAADRAGGRLRVGAGRPGGGQLDVASAAMTRWRARAAALALAAMSMAHVGSPDTFFGGKAGPYDVRISVRLPGVIPGRAQVTVRIEGVASNGAHAVTVRAGQWNVGM